MNGPIPARASSSGGGAFHRAARPNVAAFKRISWPPPLPLSRFARTTAVLVISGLAMASLMGEEGLRSVAPFFGLLLFTQLFPVARGENDLFSPALLSGVYTAFATLAIVASLVSQGQLHVGWFEHLSLDDRVALAVKVLLAQILSIVCYYVGYYNRTWGLRAARWIPEASSAAWRPGRLRLVVLTLMVIFSIAYVVFQGRLGVPVWDATQLAAGKAVWREDASLSWMLRGSQFGLLAGLIYWAHACRQSGLRSLVLPGLLLLANAWLVARIGNRSLYMFPLLAALGLFHYLRHRVPMSAFAALLAVGLVLANVQVDWRSTESRGKTLEEEMGNLFSQPIETLAAHEADRLRFSALATIFDEFPERTPHLLGATYTGLVAMFVPRWLWPEKVNHFGWRDNLIVMRLNGLLIPLPYFGVLYVNWSWLGIVVGMVLWGVFHRAIFEVRMQNASDPGVNLMYLLTVVFFVPTMMGVSAAIQYLLPAYLCIRFIGVRRPRSGSLAHAPPEPARAQ